MNTLDLDTEYGMLNAKRSVLEQSLHIASLIERLNRSLEATMVAKRPGGNLPTEALRYYEGLDELSRALPPPLLKKRIASLSQEVQQDFGHILYMTRLLKGVDPKAESHSNITDVDQFLSRFSSHTSRLVGMRVSLYKKGESSKALTLVIPTELLNQRLQALYDLERHSRLKVRNEIKTLRRDTQQMLKNPSLGESIRDQLKITLSDLQTSLQHIETGGDISEIPVLVQTIAWDPTPMSTKELSELLRGEEVEEIPVEEITITAPGNTPEPAFRETLHYWLNTPLDVSWDMVKNWQKSKQK
jgi:hypothetical protein